MAFTDIATIEVRAGKGGDGRLSFRHEKYRAMGGPDGGDGGHGGDVIFRVDHNVNTLSAYRTARLIKAENGEIGGDNRKHGKSGNDAVVKVPQGTQIWEDDQLLADLTGLDQEVVIAHGGRGGFGNAHFKSSVRQAPRSAELGERGEARKLRIELKLVADVGLVGLPNAGKSTLLSVISNAKPEIADYPFTTIVPNLGMVDLDDYSFLVADIPGLIEGASSGKGLGHEFLRHVERTAVLLHLVDAGTDDPAADYRTVRRELETHQTDLATRPEIIVLTKKEMVEPAKLAADQKVLAKAAGRTPIFVISAQTHDGLKPLLGEAANLVRTARTEQAKLQAEATIPVIDATAFPNLWRVEPEGEGVFRVTGDRIEGFARRTNFDQPDAIERLRDIMRKTGVARELRRRGAQDGDTIRLADQELSWIE
ncbi:MAG TPA: GTPase ObgE [Candidatus Saccharimonadia bacterium]|jgi:GTP-binding protein